MTWAWVSLGWATFGLGFEWHSGTQQWICREAAPIAARSSLGRGSEDVVKYWTGRGADVRWLERRS